MNNKGFMMAEVVVVSAIVLVFLAGLYASYNELYSAYSRHLDYYDTVTLYQLGYYRDVLIESGNKLNEYIAGSSESIKLEKLNKGDTAYLVKANKLNKDVVIEENLTFIDYVQFLTDSIKFKSNYVMILESCKTEDDCKYAYLEVYDGSE